MTTVCIDANNLIFRVWNVTKSLQNKGERQKLYNDRDMDCATIHAFLKSLYGICREYKPSDVYLCWDKRLNQEEPPNFRQTVLDDYKGGRTTSAEDREEIFSYMPAIVFLTTKLGYKNFFPWNLEADDCIAWIARKSTGNVVVASSDKDLLQLVDENIQYHNLGNRSLVTVDNFAKETGVDLDIFLRYKAILGDASDNIDGLRGYGAKKAPVLARNWDTEHENLSDEQIARVERNIRVMALAEELDQYEELAYETQFKQKPTIDFPTFQSRATGKYRFSNNTCIEWKTLLSNIQQETAMADYADEIFRPNP